MTDRMTPYTWFLLAVYVIALAVFGLALASGLLNSRLSYTLIGAGGLWLLNHIYFRHGLFRAIDDRVDDTP